MPVVPIFLSSTFQDFHQERDLFVGTVRERLDELVEPQGWRTEFVDLRWGIDTSLGDADEVNQQRVLDVCLAEIERSRPLFVGLVGDRYGWVPPGERLAAAVRSVDGLDDADPRWSVTALEFAYGALLRPEAEARFFVRTIEGPPPPGWVDADPTAAAWLRRWVEEARGAEHYVARSDGVRLSGLDGLADRAVEVLGPLVRERVRSAPVAAEDPSDAATRSFVESRLGFVAGRDALVEELVDGLGGGVVEQACLTGPSGIGKSAVWCTVVSELRRRGVFVAAHLVGASPGSTSTIEVVAQLAHQLGATLPPGRDEDEVVAWWSGLVAQRAGVVVAIDGVDGLDPGSARDRLPIVVAAPGVRFLLTTDDGEQAEVLRHRGGTVVEVPTLEGTVAAEAAAGLARRSGRSLPALVRDHLAGQDRSPLWIKLAVDELFALDAEAFASVDPDLAPGEAIADLLTRTVAALPGDPDGLARALLRRVDRRIGAEAGERVLALLTTARSGLAPGELVQASGASPLDVAELRRVLGSQLIARDATGRLGFSHAVFERAARARVADLDPEPSHRALLDLHLAAPSSDRAAAFDGLWHALRLGDPAAVIALAERIVALDEDAMTAIGRVVVESVVMDRGQGRPDTLLTIEQVGLRQRSADSAPGLAGVVGRRTRAIRTWGRVESASIGWLAFGIDNADTSAALTAAERHRLMAALSAASAPERTGSRARRQILQEVLTAGPLGRAALAAGDLEGARTAFAEALAASRRMLARFGPSKRPEREMAALAGPLRELADVEADLGDLDAAQAHVAEALAIDRRSVAFERSALRLTSLAQTLVAASDLDRAAGRPEAASAFAEEAAAQFDAIRAEGLGRTSPSIESGVIERVALVSLELGDLDRAAVAARRSLALRQEELARQPRSVSVRSMVGLAHNRLAEVALAGGEVEAAQGERQAALAVSRSLVDGDPTSAELRGVLATDLLSVADLVVAAGRAGEAVALLTESLGIRRSLLAQSPGSTTHRDALLPCLQRLADAQLAAGDPAGSLASAEESAERAEAACAAHPDDIERRSVLCGSHQRVALAARVLALVDRQRDALQALVEQRDRVSRAEPGDQGTHLRVSRACFDLAQLEAEHDPTAARAAAQRAVAASRRAAALEEEPGEGVQSLLEDLELAAAIADADDEREARTGWRREACELRRRQLDAEASADRWLGLAHALVRLAGDLGGAAADASTVDAVDAARRALAAETTPERERDLALVLQERGQLLARLGRPAAAAQAYAEELGIVRSLYGPDGPSPDPGVVAWVLVEVGRSRLRSGGGADAAPPLREAVELRRGQIDGPDGAARIEADDGTLEALLFALALLAESLAPADPSGVEQATAELVQRVEAAPSGLAGWDATRRELAGALQALAPGLEAGGHLAVVTAVRRRRAQLDPSLGEGF